MNDKIFLDTNVLAYLYSADELQKKQHIELILSKLDLDYVIISTQVINELIHVLHRKKKISLPILAKTVEELFEIFDVSHITESTIKKAVKLVDAHNFSYFDSLMIASALEENCTKFYSEDMHNQLIIEKKLTILNPFKLS